MFDPSPSNPRFNQFTQTSALSISAQANPATTQTTRSGRRVWFPDRFVTCQHFWLHLLPSSTSDLGGGCHRYHHMVEIDRFQYHNISRSISLKTGRRQYAWVYKHIRLFIPFIRLWVLEPFPILGITVKHNSSHSGQTGFAVWGKLMQLVSQWFTCHDRGY